MPLGFGKKDKSRRRQDLTEVVKRDLEWNGWSENARVRDHAKKLINARPWNCPGDRPFGQFRQQPPCGAVVFGGNDLGIHEDVGVDGLHASATVHEVEEFVAIEQVDSRPLLRLPAAQIELEMLFRLVLNERAPEKLVGDILKRPPFVGSLLFDPFQKIVVNCERRSGHA
jgi:hypothetical protein